MSDQAIGPQPAPANRLSIAHLLLWTATTALAIGAIMPGPVDSFGPDLSDETLAMLVRQQRLWRIATVITGPVLGAGLAALAIAAWRYRRSLPGFPSQPGHWILMIIGMSTLAFMALRMFDPVSRIQRVEYSEGLFALIGLIFAALLLLTILLLIAAYGHVTEPLRWKRVFAIAGTNIAFFLFCGCLLPIPIGGSQISALVALAVVFAVIYATPASVLVATIMDVRSRQSFDVFHWIGAVSVLALTVIFTGLALLE